PAFEDRPERHFDFGLDVPGDCARSGLEAGEFLIAAEGARSAATPAKGLAAAGERAAEQSFEEVRKPRRAAAALESTAARAAKIEAETFESRRRAKLLARLPVRPQRIVTLPGLRVFQDLVGLVDQLEAFLRVLLLVNVGV